MPRRQDRVNARQGAVNAGWRGEAESFTENVIENLIAAVLGIALLGYLVYALIRPERF